MRMRLRETRETKHETVEEIMLRHGYVREYCDTSMPEGFKVVRPPIDVIRSTPLEKLEIENIIETDNVNEVKQPKVYIGTEECTVDGSKNVFLKYDESNGDITFVDNANDATAFDTAEAAYEWMEIYAFSMLRQYNVESMNLYKKQPDKPVWYKLQSFEVVDKNHNKVELNQAG
jgi:hypothetical protein